MLRQIHQRNTFYSHCINISSDHLSQGRRKSANVPRIFETRVEEKVEEKEERFSKTQSLVDFMISRASISLRRNEETAKQPEK